MAQSHVQYRHVALTMERAHTPTVLAVIRILVMDIILMMHVHQQVLRVVVVQNGSEPAQATAAVVQKILHVMMVFIYLMVRVCNAKRDTIVKTMCAHNVPVQRIKMNRVSHHVNHVRQPRIRQQTRFRFIRIGGASL